MIVVYKDNIKQEYQLLNGQLHGIYKEYMLDATTNNWFINKETSYFNGKRQGPQIQYIGHNIQFQVFNYDNDLLEGKQKYFNVFGCLMVVELYRNNQLIRKKKYKLLPGSVSISYPYSITTYDSNGNIQKQDRLSFKQYFNGARIPNLSESDKQTLKTCYICFDTRQTSQFRLTCTNPSHSICFKCRQKSAYLQCPVCRAKTYPDSD